MPEMYEIYEKHADRYHELVRAEDYQENLPRKLRDLLDWRGLTVLEGGVGTGRVTRLYIDAASAAICCDKSLHMLDYARHALAPFLGKITWIQADNRQLPALGQPVDAFIEGWSFGHALDDCVTEDAIRTVTASLVQNATKNLRPGGRVILIETLGTNVEVPGAPSDKLKLFYRFLEEHHGFTPAVIRTDYRFASSEEAMRILGFFFGPDRIPAIQARQSAIIPEWTGLWTKIVCAHE